MLGGIWGGWEGRVPERQRGRVPLGLERWHCRNDWCDSEALLWVAESYEGVGGPEMTSWPHLGWGPIHMSVSAFLTPKTAGLLTSAYQRA